MNFLTKKDTLRAAAMRQFEKEAKAGSAEGYYTFPLTIGGCEKAQEAVVGDYVAWVMEVFEGSFRNATFAGYRVEHGRILKDSYGEKSAQHTFTIKLDSGETVRRKGRTLFKKGCYLVDRPAGAEARLEEKHERGLAAKTAALQGWLETHTQSHSAYDQKQWRLNKLLAGEAA